MKKNKNRGEFQLHWASLEIFWVVSWIPNPIREAFLLNSDPEEAGPEGLDGDWAVCDWLTAVIPPIFCRVSESDRNSEVRSRYVEAIGNDKPEMHNGWAEYIYVWSFMGGWIKRLMKFCHVSKY